MGRGEPKHVRKLIADAQERKAAAQERKVDGLVIGYIKRIIASQKEINNRDRGTRGNGRGK